MTHDYPMTLNVTTIAHFLLGACVPIHIFVWKEKNLQSYAKNVRRCHVEFRHMGDLAHEIGALLVQGMVLGVVIPCNLIGGYQHFGGTCSLHR